MFKATSFLLLRMSQRHWHAERAVSVHCHCPLGNSQYNCDVCDDFVWMLRAQAQVCYSISNTQEASWAKGKVTGERPWAPQELSCKHKLRGGPRTPQRPRPTHKKGWEKTWSPLGHDGKCCLISSWNCALVGTGDFYFSPRIQTELWIKCLLRQCAEGWLRDIGKCSTSHPSKKQNKATARDQLYLSNEHRKRNGIHSSRMKKK